jgi:hypothetical protein
MAMSADPKKDFEARAKELEAKFEAALDAVFDHPFWNKFPKVLLHGSIPKHLEGWNEVVIERIMLAMQCLHQDDRVEAREKSFLFEARKHFPATDGFIDSVIDFFTTVTNVFKADDKKVQDEELRRHMDVLHLICLAAREKPELLDFLNVGLYPLDASVRSEPLNKILHTLVDIKALQVAHRRPLKCLLATMKADWKSEICETAQKSLAAHKYFNEEPHNDCRVFVAEKRKDKLYKSIWEKLRPVACGLREAYPEATVLRFEAICYVMHAARLSHHN